MQPKNSIFLTLCAFILVFSLSQKQVTGGFVVENGTTIYDDIDAKYLGYKESDIIQDSYIRQESSLKYCDYRYICNPTSLNYRTSLNAYFEFVRGDVDTHDIEIEVPYTEYYNQSDCTTERVHDNKNKSWYDLETCTYKEVSINRTRWVSSAEWIPYGCLWTRQCISKKNNLDSFNIDMTSRFANIDIINSTTINSTGLNVTILNISQVLKYFSFDAANVSGNVVRDLSFNGDGLNQGAESVTAGVLNEAFSFVSANTDWVNVSFSTDEAIGFMSFWFNYTLDATFRVIIEFDNGVGSAVQIGLRTFQSKLDFLIHSGDVTAYRAQPSSQPSNDVWHHVLFGVNASGTYVYIDNVEQTMSFSTGDASSTVWLDDAAETELIIGARDNGAPSGFFNGDVDEVFIGVGYPSSEERAAIYNLGDAFNQMREVYGDFNATGTFNQTNFSSASLTDKNWLNLSDDDITWNGTGTNMFNWTVQKQGFKARIDSSKVSNVFFEIGNLTEAAGPTDTCTPPGSGDWVVEDQCQIVDESHNICPNNINITSTGFLNVTGTSEINASKIFWVPRDAEDAFRLRWEKPASIKWGVC